MNLDRLVTATVTHATPGLCLATAVFLAIFCGVVLPAVWSTKPARRRAAIKVLELILIKVLELILRTLRRPRSP